MKRLFIALALLGLALPGAARAEAPAGCPGSPLGPEKRSFTGTFSEANEGSYVLVPFSVAEGTMRVGVRICYDQPPTPASSQIKHNLDLGVYEATTDGVYDNNEFRGWGGSSRPSVLLTPEQATVGFIPGPIPAGEWAAEIGVAAVAGIAEGDPDGTVSWRLEVFTGADTGDLDSPWTPTPYDEAPAATGPGWYKGDFHVHAEHSAPGDASMRETFDYAFGGPGPPPPHAQARAASAPGWSKGAFHVHAQRSAPGDASMRETFDYAFGADTAGLDFITLSDYVTDRHWAEIGRLQADYPGKLVMRSAEVITYRGHINNHGSATYVDYRTGPIYELRDGSLRQVRGAQPASRIFDDIHAAGGFTQVNHPTTFPSAVPGFGNICRGC